MYFVVRVFFNQEGTQSNSIQKYTELLDAQKRYYTILASDIDNNNYQYELVMIVDDHGVIFATQVFDRRYE